MACIRKRRGKWVIDFRDQFGRRHWQTVGTNKKEAEDRLAEKVLDVRRGQFNPEASRLPFETYAERWMTNYAEVNVKVRTVESYRWALKSHLLPVLGRAQLRSLTRDGVRTLIAELIQKGLSRNSVRIVHATLRTILNAAIDDGLIATNPAQRVGKFGDSKADKKKNMNPLSADEINTFLAAVNEHFPGYYLFFMTLVRTGMRLGEARGLQWDDIDFGGGFITIRRTLDGTRSGTPKSGDERRIDMSGQLAHLLQQLRQMTTEAAMKRGLGKVPEWVFCTAQGKPFDEHNLRRRVFYPALLKAGLRRIRPHDLRHSFASILIQNREPLPYVRDMLGHHSIKITVDTYGHLIPGGNRQAVDALDDVNWKRIGSRMVANEAGGGAGGGSKVSQLTEKIGGPPENGSKEPAQRTGGATMGP